VTQTRGVYFFDEFDSIGSQRGIANEVGEIRRVLNSFLQFIEQDDSDSLILAATNHPDILDYALFRRFDDIIEYRLPHDELIIKVIKFKLAPFKKTRLNWKKLVEVATKLSYADICRACEDAVKDMIIHDRDKLSNNDLIKPLSERKLIRNSSLSTTGKMVSW
jgi:SpoVK/Ycf46/Vps4 family AAA+-type ATPase